MPMFSTNVVKFLFPKFYQRFEQNEKDLSKLIAAHNKSIENFKQTITNLDTDTKDLAKSLDHCSKEISSLKNEITIISRINKDVNQFNKELRQKNKILEKKLVDTDHRMDKQTRFKPRKIHPSFYRKEENKPGSPGTKTN